MGNVINPNSPFSKTNFQAFEEFSKPGILEGLLLPNGEVLVNFEHNTSTHTLFGIARQLNAEVISVKGTWQFVPDKTSIKHVKIPNSGQAG
jgi:hypothetical protein